jgi:homogentisate 1,2-dioxygenase
MYVDIQEIFGSQFELPDLGTLGSHGLANPRDFESPVASFDVDQSPWKGTCWVPRKRYAFFDVAFLYVVVYKYVMTDGFIKDNGLYGVRRLGGRLFACKQDHTPFDVVAWHGKFAFPFLSAPASLLCSFT